MEINENYKKISLAEYLNLLDIFKFRKKDKIIFSELAKEINTKDTNSIFRNNCKKLIVLKIFKYVETIGKSNFYIIDFKKLDDYIRQNYIYKKTKEFVISADPLMHEL